MSNLIPLPLNFGGKDGTSYSHLQLLFSLHVHYRWTFEQLTRVSTYSRSKILGLYHRHKSKVNVVNPSIMFTEEQIRQLRLKVGETIKVKRVNSPKVEVREDLDDPFYVCPVKVVPNSVKKIEVPKDKPLPPERKEYNGLELELLKAVPVTVPAPVMETTTNSYLKEGVIVKLFPPFLKIALRKNSVLVNDEIVDEDEILEEYDNSAYTDYHKLTKTLPEQETYRNPGYPPVKITLVSTFQCRVILGTDIDGEPLCCGAPKSENSKLSFCSEHGQYMTKAKPESSTKYKKRRRHPRLNILVKE